MSSVETEKPTEQPTGEVATTPVTVANSSSCSKCLMADVFLRLLLLAASIVAVVVMATSKQTEILPDPARGGIPGPRSAKFTQSPAFIYFITALSVAGLYSLITAITSMSIVVKPNAPPKLFWILIAHDVLILGVVAAATGTAGGVAYIGLKGNSHVQWAKICGVYDKFCRYVGGSIAVSIFAGVILVVLVIINSYSLYRRIPGSDTSVFF